VAAADISKWEGEGRIECGAAFWIFRSGNGVFWWILRQEVGGRTKMGTFEKWGQWPHGSIITEHSGT